MENKEPLAMGHILWTTVIMSQLLFHYIFPWIPVGPLFKKLSLSLLFLNQ